MRPYVDAAAAAVCCGAALRAGNLGPVAVLPCGFQGQSIALLCGKQVPPTSDQIHHNDRGGED